MKKTICAVLLCVLLLPLFSHNAFAESRVSADVERFMFENFSSDNSTVSLSENGTVLVRFRGAAPILFADFPVPVDAEHGNAIRLVLKNDSYCNLLRVSYTCNDEIRQEQIAIERRSGKQDYFLYVEDAENITDMRLSFSGGTSGSVELYGMGIVSVYDDSTEQPGEITDCTYDATEKKVTVSGNIKHEIVANTSGASFALYAFDQGDSVSDVRLASATPIATLPFSVRFDFSVSAVSFSERFMQYVVAVVASDGSVLYRYSSAVPSMAGEKERETAFFKGVDTGHTSLAVSADAQVAFVDVYLDRMQSPRNNGLLHIEDGQYFYIDRSYVYELDNIIGQYSKNGSRVYLRFLLSGGLSYTVLHGGAPVSADAVYNGISLSGDDARLTLFAYTRFLCERYAGSKQNVMDGIVLGRSVDRAEAFNYVGKKTVEAYTETYATALHVISEAAKQSGTELELVVPFSDLYDSDAGAVGILGQYPSRLLLVSLCKMLSNRFGGGFSMRVLLESDALPARLLSEDSGGYASVDCLSEWETTLAILSEGYGVLGEGYFYRWSPPADLSEETVVAAYAYTYYKLAAGQATGLIFAPDGIEDATVLRSLFDTVKYINTHLSLSKNQLAPLALGAETWDELVPGLDDIDFGGKQVWVYQTAFSPPFSVRGSNAMWDHKQGRNLYDWSASTDCSSLLVEDVDGIGRALVASFSGEAVYSEIVYAYAAKEIMNAVDMLSAEIMVVGEPGRVYELVFEVCGDTSACVMTAEVESGQKVTVYVSTLQLGKNDPIKSIRLFFGPEEGAAPYQVCVSQLVAHSNTLTDVTLGEALADARYAPTTDGGAADDDGDTSSWQLPALLGVLLLFVSAVIVLTLARRSEE